MTKDQFKLMAHIDKLEKMGCRVPYGMFKGMLDVLEFGAVKYEANNWLEPDGVNTDQKSMYGSIFRHTAEAYSGRHKDLESGLPPEAHAQVRLGMMLTRKEMGI